MIEINGTHYLRITGNVCTTCSADKRYMYVKLVTPGKDHVLECPVCTTVLTVSQGMVVEVSQ